ncbi:MAG: hypothetical protein WKF43_01580 [Acidimicrobiales bacterium]
MVKPALEAALSVARVGETSDPPVRAPAGVRKVLGFARLNSGALAAVRRVLEQDEQFRLRVADTIDEATIGRPAWLWLCRPDRWQEEFDALATELAEADDEARASSEQARLRRALARAEQAVGRAEGARTRAEHDAPRARRSGWRAQGTASGGRAPGHAPVRARRTVRSAIGGGTGSESGPGFARRHAAERTELRTRLRRQRADSAGTHGSRPTGRRSCARAQSSRG